jgi:hypothetical protein
VTTPTDLAPYMVPPDRAELGFHQALVVFFDSASGVNTMLVAGGTVLNVPMLNIGDSVNIKTGDTVALLRYRSTYFVLGRVMVPGASDFGSSGIAVQGGGVSASTFAVTTSFVVQTTVSLTVPAWATRALVLGVTNTTVQNTTASSDSFQGRTQIDGTAGGTGGCGLTAGFAGEVTTSAQRVVTHPGSSIVVQGLVRSITAPWAASASNIQNLDVICTFTRV